MLARLGNRLSALVLTLAAAAAPLAIVTSSALLAGCPKAQTGGLSGGIRRAPLDATAAAQHQGLVAEGDAAWANRADRAQLELAIQKWEAAVQIKDDDVSTYDKLSRGLYLLADGWLSFEKEEKLDLFLATHKKGFDYAARGLAALSKDFEQRLSTGVDMKDAVALIGRDGVGLMYWYATNLGKWGNAQDITVVLEYKDRIVAIMSRVTELDPAYFYGAPDRYWGAFYAIAPSFAGGDLAKSWDHFQASIKLEPKYVATYNLIAENYAPKKSDGALFDQMIKTVMDTPMDAIPGLEPEFAVEKRKAELLVKRREAGEFPFD
jgi:hypothetical protein